MSPERPTVPELIQSAARSYRVGELAEARRRCEDVLETDPDNAQALQLHGLILHGLGNPQRALESLERAAGLDRSDPALLNNLGECYRGLGRQDEAESCYRKALEIRPDYAPARAGLGTLLYGSSRFEQTAENYLSFARSLELVGRLKESESMYRCALAQNAGEAEAHRGLGRALEGLGRMEDAAESWRRTLALRPDYADVHHDLGTMLMLLRQPEEAERCYRRALELKPDFAMASFGRSLALLMRGDYGSGLPLYEYRFDSGDIADDAPIRPLLAQMRSLPRWRGEPLEGRTLLLWTEQGFGDSLMVMRYLPLLKGLHAKRSLVYCEPSLVRLFRAMNVVDEVVSKEDPVPLGAFDRHCPMMSLPLMLHTRIETIPAEVPYARVPEDVRDKWADRLAALAPPRVGVVWAGGRLFRDDPLRSRSIRPEIFSPLLEVAGVNFVSLQKGEDANAIRERGWRITDPMEDCGDFLDTAALIGQLDLVVSVDTAVAHLAGALGKPVWMLNRVESEWRWMLEREDSPWYPSMRIFRQSIRGEWGDVVGRAAKALGSEYGPRKPAWSLRRLFTS